MAIIVHVVYATARPRAHYHPSLFQPAPAPAPPLPLPLPLPPSSRRLFFTWFEAFHTPVFKRVELAGVSP